MTIAAWLAVAALAAANELGADLYPRAGRSAAAQSDAGTARPWLERVLSPTENRATEQAAEAALAGLP